MMSENHGKVSRNQAACVKHLIPDHEPAGGLKEGNRSKQLPRWRENLGRPFSGMSGGKKKIKQKTRREKTCGEERAITVAEDSCDDYGKGKSSPSGNLTT